MSVAVAGPGLDLVVEEVAGAERAHAVTVALQLVARRQVALKPGLAVSQVALKPGLAVSQVALKSCMVASQVLRATCTFSHVQYSSFIVHQNSIDARAILMHNK